MAAPRGLRFSALVAACAGALLLIAAPAAAQNGAIAGTIRNAGTNALIGNVTVRAYNPSGVQVASSVTSFSGTYSISVPAGTYYVRTDGQALTLNVLDELYDDILCVPSCVVTAGTPIVVSAGVTHGGIDFGLQPGAAITGTVKDGASAGIAGITVQAYTAAGVVAATRVTAGSAGAYALVGMLTGTYYVRTVTTPAQNYIDEVYNNVPCMGCAVTAGTPLSLTVNTITQNIDFVLAPGGTISGAVTDQVTSGGLSNVAVDVYTAAGAFVKEAITGGGGVYSVAGLASGSYVVRTAVPAPQNHYINEVYDDIPCIGPCSLASATLVPVTAGSTTGAGFALSLGGTITGSVTDEISNAPISGATVQIFTAAGVLLGAFTTDAAGLYTAPGLPAATYYARTAVAGVLPYFDELYNQRPCPSSCTPTAGSAIALAVNTTRNISFTLAPNLIPDGSFSTGLAGWAAFSVPAGLINASVISGVLNFNRVSPATEAEMIRSTGLAVAADTPFEATFDLANTDSIRKRLKVLIHRPDFTDSSSCTFFLDANAPMRTYRMRMRSTAALDNVTISFYASTTGTGGFYQIDNVTLQQLPGGQTDRTECIDPTVPAASGGVTGPNLLTNGDFATGTLSPWIALNAFDWQITNGVLEFRRTASSPPPVVAQFTGQGVANDEILTATFQLGNSDTVRHRVKVLVHDSDFSDAPSCVFWIPPAQPLTYYSMTIFTTKPWTNASVSVYPSTGSVSPWTLLDDVTLQSTPWLATTGTSCFENTGPPDLRPATRTPTAAPESGAGQLVMTRDRRVGDAASAVVERGASAATGAEGRSSAGTWVSPDQSWTRSADGTWTATATGAGARVLEWHAPAAFARASASILKFQSHLAARSSRAEVQVSLGGGDWIVLARIGASDTWDDLVIPLDGFIAQSLVVRLVFDGVPPTVGADADEWHVRDLAVEGP